MHILVAEDDAMARATVAELLQTMGHRLTLAEDGDEAWQLVSHVHFPLIIADWKMPGLDGLELCRRIRSSRRPTYSYVILITGREGRPDFLEGMEAGADDFLTAPVDADTLRARLRVAERVLGLERTVGQLRGLLPTCLYCQRVRDDDATAWEPIDRYLATRTSSALSHGVCPECSDAHFTSAGRNGARV